MQFHQLEGLQHPEFVGLVLEHDILNIDQAAGLILCVQPQTAIGGRRVLDRHVKIHVGGGVLNRIWSGPPNLATKSLPPLA